MRRSQLVSLLGVAMLGAACAHSAKAKDDDSAFAAVQKRGAAVMGVDQYTSAHVFEDLPDGGRIVLERKDTTDSAGSHILAKLDLPSRTRLALWAAEQGLVPLDG